MSLTRAETKEARQRALNEAWDGLRAQGRPGMGDNRSCLLRGDNGTKCALGFLISDEVYDPTMEGMVIEQLLPFMPKWVEDCGITFVRKLRHAHDAASASEFFIGAFRENLRDLTIVFNLDRPEGL